MKEVLNLENTNSSPSSFEMTICSFHETSCKHDEFALEIKLYNYNETLGNPGTEQVGSSESDVSSYLMRRVELQLFVFWIYCILVLLLHC